MYMYGVHVDAEKKSRTAVSTCSYCERARYITWGIGMGKDMDMHACAELLLGLRTP